MQSELEPDVAIDRDFAESPLASAWATYLLNPLANFRITPTQAQQMSPAALAYVGDAIYELYVRTRYLIPPKRLHLYHEQVVAHVRAESQAQQLQAIEPYLTEIEQKILKRGRNAASKRPRRLTLDIYQRATSLEALLGYLYLTDAERLTEILQRLTLADSISDLDSKPSQ